MSCYLTVRQPIGGRVVNLTRLAYLAATWPGNDCRRCDVPQPAPWWVWCILLPFLALVLMV